MSYFEFPNTRTYNNDLGWVIAAVTALKEAMETFIGANTLTFADPLLHDLTTQYNKNTIVLDSNGNAYLSLKIVPAGINLSNTEYWLMIFDYEAFLEKVNKNFTSRYYRNENRAKTAMSVGDWLTFDDVLCKVTAAIAVDDVIEEGTNIEAFTLEDFIKAFMTSASTLIQQYKDDIDASELAYQAAMQAEVDRILAGATVDSEVIDARLGADDVNYTTLGLAIRTQFEHVKNIINNFENRVFHEYTLSPFSSYTLGMYRSFTTGGPVYESDCAISGGLNIRDRQAVSFSDSDYLFSICGFSGTPVSTSTFVNCLSNGWVEAGTIIPVPKNTPAISLAVKRKDGTTIVDADMTAIKAAFVYYRYTDETLTERGTPADSKIVGDSFTERDFLFNNLESRLFYEYPLSPFSTVYVGQYRDLSTGSLENDASCMVSASLNTSNRQAVTYTDSNYLFSVVGFTGTPIGTGTYYGCLSNDWIEAGNIVPIPKECPVISLAVKTVDGTAIDAGDADTIKANFKYYRYTDTTMSESNVPADAAAVGGIISSLATSCFTSKDDVALENTYSGVIDLYDALVTDHSDYITKNALTYDDFTNYEYVLTIGNYNTSGFRNPDPVIYKPKILLMAGTHGYEQSSVMSLYNFTKCLCENVMTLNGLIDYIEFHIIPIVCPWGYDNDSRINENGVNINRNFNTSDWTLTSIGDNYSGASPADQDETQVVQNWITTNNDAILFIDWHNSSKVTEISCLVGALTSQALAIKKEFLHGVNDVIPYWNKYRNIPSTNKYAYAGSSSATGTSATYARESNLQGFTLETSWNIKSTGKHSNFTIAVGTEAFANALNKIFEYLD